MPRPKTIPIKDLVRELAGLNCSQSEIARVCKVSVSTLQKNYKSEMTKGKEYVKTELLRAQFRSALNGSFVMQIWLGKNLLGQADKIETHNKEEILITRDLKTFEKKDGVVRAVSKPKTKTVLSKRNPKTKTKIKTKTVRAKSEPKTKIVKPMRKIKSKSKAVSSIVQSTRRKRE